MSNVETTVDTNVYCVCQDLGRLQLGWLKNLNKMEEKINHYSICTVLTYLYTGWPISENLTVSF